MKLYTFKTIKNRLIFWFLFLTITPLFLVLTIIYVQQVRIIKNEAAEKLIAIRDLKVIEIENWISERENDLYAISANNELTDLSDLLNKVSLNKQEKKRLDNVRNIINNYLINYSIYSEIFVIDIKNAKILVSTNKLMEGKYKGTDEYFTINKKSKKVSIKNIYFSNTLKKNSMAFSTPIFSTQHNNQEVIGILVARIDLENSLYKLLLDRVGLGKTGETIIVNKDAIILSMLRWHNSAPLKLRILTEPAINAAAEKTDVKITKDYRGHKILAAYTFIPKVSWGFICKQDTEELYAPINLLQTKILISFLLSLSISLFIIFIISKSISTPIINLNKAAKKIKSGDLSARSVSSSSYEIGNLNTVFNSMAGTIESKMKIQKKVKDISETMINQTSLHEFSSSLLSHLMKISEVDISIFYILNETIQEYEHFISYGINSELLKTIIPKKIVDEFKNTLDNKDMHLITDVPAPIILKYKNIANGIIPKEIITIPVIVDNLIIALITLVNVNKFDKESVEVIKQILHSINISFSNLLSNERTRIFAENLMQNIEQLEQKSEVLRIKSRKLVQKTKELKMLNKELETFAYSVSHDLRAPLRHIDGFTKLLEKKIKDKLDKQSTIYFNNIISSSSRMNQLIEDLLAFSRTSTKNMRKSDVNMKRIVDEVVSSYSLEIENNNISFVVDKLPDVNVDISLFKQVWDNLISNAIKFTSNNKNPEIHISTNRNPKGETIFFIKDNGVGFDQKYADNMFGVFQRLHTIHEFPGTGIGLANVKRIIVKHGGIIWAEGAVNIGATFFFKLP